MKKAQEQWEPGTGGKGNSTRAPRVCDTSLKKFCQNMAYHGGHGPTDSEFLFVVKEVYGVTFSKDRAALCKLVKGVDTVKLWMRNAVRKGEDGKRHFCRDDGRTRIVGQDSHTILPPALDKLADAAIDKYRGKKPVASK